MSTTAPSPAGTPAAPAKKSLWKTGLGMILGLFSGAAAMYATAVFNTVVKPNPPVANFAVTADGLNATCQNHALGTTGWWDYGDGSPLEPFAPEQTAVTHAYAKSGNYSIKLTVRNFLMDENDRSVPVELKGSSQIEPISVSGLQVEAIGSKSDAPAAFRIRGEAKNAEKVILDLGDRVEVNTENGPFERLVVFEKPGHYPIQLIGHTGKVAVKQSAFVTVTAPATGSVSVVLKVTDSGSRVEKQSTPKTVPIAAPPKGTKTVERVIPATPGYTINQASVGKVTTTALKNLKLEVAADKKSAKLSGEWGGAEAEALVPVMLQEERGTSIILSPETVSAAFTSTGLTVTLPLPPQPRNAAGLQRKMYLEFREASADGTSRVVLIVPDLKPPYSGTVNTVLPVRGSFGPQPVSAQLAGESLVVKWGR